MKRFRITFTKEGELKHISHLDLMRAWERALRRAKVPLAFSKGFNPHPRILAAMPLAVGLTSEAELLDVFLELDDDFAPAQLRAMIEPQMPPGMRISDVTEVPLDAPSLQAQLAFAEYRVALADGLSREEAGAQVAAFMVADQVMRPRRQKPGKGSGKGGSYNLRALVDDVWLERPDDVAASSLSLGLRLKAGPGAEAGESGVGRPDELLDALGLADQVIEIRRTRLVFASKP